MRCDCRPAVDIKRIALLLPEVIPIIICNWGCVHITYALLGSFLTHPPPLYNPSTPLANPPSKVRTMSADPPPNCH